ncbi:MAG: SAM-dependent methyltransferase [Pseudomonadota bacterium]
MADAKSPLEQKLIERILADGPISVADFMQASLTDKTHGYYTSKQPIGSDGDFITAPEISQIFGELIGLWAGDVWHNMGSPKPIILCELGPGKGTLMQDALRALKHVPEFLDHVHIHLVESNPYLRDLQRTKLEDIHLSIEWHECLSDLPEGPVIVIANEFLDALPVQQFQRKEPHWYERMVGVRQSAGAQYFEFIINNEPAQTLDLSHPDIEHAEERAILEIRPFEKTLLTELSRRSKNAHTCLLMIDYGHEDDGFGDTLQAVKSHHFSDPLKHIGLSDLTTHVNFARLKAQSLQLGLSCFGPMSQGAFLMQLGANLRLQQLLKAATPEQRNELVSGVSRLVSPDKMGVLFKVMVVCCAQLAKPAPF